MTEDMLQAQSTMTMLNNLYLTILWRHFDYDRTNRKNASLRNRSIVYIVKRKKSMNYLKRKPASQQKRILAFARENRKKFCKHNNSQEEKACIAIKELFVMID